MPDVRSDAELALTWGRVIGLRVAASNLGSVAGHVIRMAHHGCGEYVCVANVHMLVRARRDAKLGQVLERAAIVVSDGMPLVRRLRASGFPEARQTRGPDLMMELCRRAAEQQLPVYFFGGDDALMAQLSAALGQRVPELRIAGCAAAPMLPVQPTVDPGTVKRIRDSGARIVFIGLGCPKQEFWMGAYSSQLDAVLLGVGQAFAIAAGRQPEAPRWMRERSLEWLFRLRREPRRLGPRYLVTNSLFLLFVLYDYLTGQR